MALPALGWKVQVWVPSAPTLTSLHCCHASSLHEERGASRSQCGGSIPLTCCWGHPVPAASAASLLLHFPRTGSAACSWRGCLDRSDGEEVQGRWW